MDAHFLPNLTENNFVNAFDFEQIGIPVRSKTTAKVQLLSYSDKIYQEPGIILSENVPETTRFFFINDTFRQVNKNPEIYKIPYAQRILFGILLNQTEIRLYLPFSD